MNQDFNLSQNQLDSLVKLAGKKMGIDPNDLKQQMESGQMDGILNNLNSNQKAQMQNLMNNPKAIQQLMENPKLQALIKNLTGNK